MEAFVTAARSIAIATLIGALNIPQAFANCPSGNLTRTQLTALLPSKFTCTIGTPADGWNEQLVGGGTVVEYAKGPTDPIDPSHTVGTWVIGGDDTTGGTITYTYSGGGGTYSYYIDSTASGPYLFCPVAGGTNLSLGVQSAHC